MNTLPFLSPAILLSSEPAIEVTDMVNWVEDLNFWRAPGIAALVFAGFWAAGAILFRGIFPALKKRWNNQEHEALYLIVEGFGRPLSVLFKVMGLCYALLSLGAWLPETTPYVIRSFFSGFEGFLHQALRISSILAVTWGLVRSSKVTGLLLKNARHRMGLHMSKSVTRFLGAVYKVVVISLAVVILLSELHYDVNGLIAGLGLGGLTIALAAKDSASNFFGGLVLVTEKPFEIGDWIICQNIEGIVEDITLRSTKIRTGAGALTIVPNSVLSAAAITNWSGKDMKVRRADFAVCLTYSTPREKLKAYCDDLRATLENDPDVAGESIIVRFSQLADSSLNIGVRFNVTQPAYGDFMAVMERINFQVVELAESHGVEFALPSRTVYLHQDDA